MMSPDYHDLESLDPDTLPELEAPARPPGWHPMVSERVLLLCSLGVPPHRIAFLVGLSIQALQKRYLPELTLGGDRATEVVAQSLFHNAVNGNTAAQIFWLKCRAGWKEGGSAEDEQPLPKGLTVRYLPPGSNGE